MCWRAEPVLVEESSGCRDTHGLTLEGTGFRQFGNILLVQRIQKANTITNDRHNQGRRHKPATQTISK